MRNGFIFDHDLCVACYACSAACMLGNDWAFKARNIFTVEEECKTGWRVVNISMACNHCSDAVCMKGCPAKAYYRDSGSNAVIIEPGKCIGCRYCLWNCPYGAPTFNDSKGVIEKCHLCSQRIEEGDEPSCSLACPTGALSYGVIPENNVAGPYSWMPEKKLDPALKLKGPVTSEGLYQVPADKTGRHENIIARDKRIAEHWSLVLFTFILAVSVSFEISSATGGTYFRIATVPMMLLAAGIISMFHIRKRWHAWNSVINVADSPLSRELAAYIIFTILVLCNRLIESALLDFTCMAAGLILLILVDQVYHYSDPSWKIIFHSGQTFLTSLLLISYLIDSYLPFLFISSVKCIIIIYILYDRKNRSRTFALRFIRLGLLVIIMMIIITHTYISKYTGLTILLTGEFIDRLLFYEDFEPENMSDMMKKE